MECAEMDFTLSLNFAQKQVKALQARCTSLSKSHLYIQESQETLLWVSHCEKKKQEPSYG